MAAKSANKPFDFEEFMAAAQVFLLNSSYHYSTQMFSLLVSRNEANDPTQYFLTYNSE